MTFTKSITLGLLLVHGFLLLWATVGFIEWFWETPPWPRVSNPEFPRDVLFIQWTLTLAAGIVFIVGFILAWPRTPIALACVYAAMAALCAVETTRYMQSDTRYIAMALEYVAYAAILVFLFRSSSFPPS
ncbi:MAG: hypothetical protein KF689_11965 [Gemmatimonadaceae bacterium]|nr:hypothetical protein [Gemmatimonadaceae bacterium]MCW5827305.1 hypothetical protein [Gemmatimonadaceae bacterium]